MLIITIEGMIYVQIDACFLNFLKVITPALFKKSFEFLIIDMMSLLIEPSSFIIGVLSILNKPFK